MRKKEIIRKKSGENQKKKRKILLNQMDEFEIFVSINATAAAALPFPHPIPFTLPIHCSFACTFLLFICVFFFF